MQKNRVELAGYLAARPEARYLPSGTPVANARLAEGYRYTDRSGQMQEHTNWHSVVFYGDLAEIALGYDKGDNVLVEGTLQIRKFTPRDPVVDLHAAESIQEAALGAQEQVIVFPETVVRSWTAATDVFWEPALRQLRTDGKTILVGSLAPSPRSEDEYLNVVAIKGADETAPFQQRIPVPLAMWKPWGGKQRVPLRLFGPATLEVAGELAAVLVCYEQLLPWTFLTALSQQPTILVGVSNSHWTKDTVIPRNQQTALRSWGRLFAKPVVSATNH